MEIIAKTGLSQDAVTLHFRIYGLSILSQKIMNKYQLDPAKPDSVNIRQMFIAGATIKEITNNCVFVRFSPPMFEAIDDLLKTKLETLVKQHDRKKILKILDLSIPQFKRLTKKYQLVTPQQQQIEYIQANEELIVWDYTKG